MKFQVAEFVVDTDRYRISAGDTAVPVEPKVFDLLIALIRHRDRVVSREELFQTVWEGREVSDATLGNHVMSARRILGDNGELQRTILTVRSRGYQFIAPVTEIPEDAQRPAPAAAPAAAEPPPTSPARRSWRLPLLLAGVLLLVGLAVIWRSLAPPGAAPGSDLPYVLVVPFDVSGPAPERWAPFADQVTREVIGNLRKISGLRVVPTPSAFTFKANKTRERVRDQLPDVRYVLDGAVSISGDNQLRITAELEDLVKGRVIWSHAYEGRTDDTQLFAMQSQIAAAVSASLKVAILADERRALGELPTANLKAYELYVAGRHELDLVSGESLPRAIALFNQAIALDPHFFDAYIARSDAYRQRFAYFEPPISMLQAVVDSLAEAQQVRPDSAEAWSSLGLSYVMAWRWKDAWAALNAAKRRDPTLAQTELGFALYYAGLGEAAKVKGALATANRLDPLNAEMADWGNWALFMVGESAAARDWAEQKMRQHPDIGLLFSGAGVGAYIAGDTGRGVKLAERGVELDRSPVALIMLAQAYGYAGQKEKVQPLLEEAARAGTYACPYESAAAWLSLGDTDRAFVLLEEAVAKRSNCLIFLRNDPRMKVLHRDPRYSLLLTRVGLDDTAVAAYKR
jgi:DNA-binding winged helix-turn-helix (wHTH) protein/TolB-like protein/Tfp pilus assembly protein PilF